MTRSHSKNFFQPVSALRALCKQRTDGGGLNEVFPEVDGLDAARVRLRSAARGDPERGKEETVDVRGLLDLLGHAAGAVAGLGVDADDDG